MEWIVLSGPILNGFITDITSKINASDLGVSLTYKESDISKFRIMFKDNLHSFTILPVTKTIDNIYYTDIKKILEKQDYCVDLVQDSSITYISICGCIQLTVFVFIIIFMNRLNYQKVILYHLH